MFKRLTALSVIIIIQTALAIFMGGAFLNGISAGKILPGVISAGVPIGGMSPGEAEKVLSEKFSAVESDFILLEGEGRQWVINVQNTGAAYDYREAVRNAYSVGRKGSFVRRISDMLGNRTESVAVPMPLKFDTGALKKELEKINREYAKNPRDARLVLENEQVKLEPGGDGLEIDIEATMDRFLNLHAGMTPVVAIVSKRVPVKIKDEDISGLSDVLGQCVTQFDSESRERAENIARAVIRLEGALVKPGEIFSFNEKLSPVNEQSGFKKAPVIVDGQLVDDYGGGICQVATTIYGAVLLSGLEIIERHHHSRTVKYVPPGLDATVSEGLMDFRFRNNLGRPVYIILSGGTEDGYVRAVIAGRKEENTLYRIETEVKTVSPGMVMKSSSHLGPGQSVVAGGGSPGFEVTVYRVSVPEGGGERRELISSDSYPPEPMVVEVGLLSGERQ